MSRSCSRISAAAVSPSFSRACIIRLRHVSSPPSSDSISCPRPCSPPHCRVSLEQRLESLVLLSASDPLDVACFGSLSSRSLSFISPAPCPAIRLAARRTRRRSRISASTLALSLSRFSFSRGDDCSVSDRLCSIRNVSSFFLLGPFLFPVPALRGHDPPLARGVLSSRRSRLAFLFSFLRRVQPDSTDSFPGPPLSSLLSLLRAVYATSSACLLRSLAILLTILSSQLSASQLSFLPQPLEACAADPP